MQLLAIDTGTETLSIAVSVLRAGQTNVYSHTGAAGPAASTTLIPAILGLLEQAGVALTELDAIAFGAGPGSFTGLRTACAVAQGLGFGARVPLLAVDSLLAVAEEARYSALGNTTKCCVTAVLDARMDEVYAGTYCYDAGQWRVQAPPELLSPQEVAQPAGLHTSEHGPWCVAGNAFAVYGGRVAQNEPRASAVVRVNAVPTAVAMLRLAPAMLASGRAVHAAQALPVYLRDKVAKTTLERAAEKAASKALVAATGSEGAL